MTPMGYLLLASNFGQAELSTSYVIPYRTCSDRWIWLWNWFFCWWCPHPKSCLLPYCIAECCPSTVLPKKGLRHSLSVPPAKPAGLDKGLRMLIYAYPVTFAHWTQDNSETLLPAHGRMGTADLKEDLGVWPLLPSFRLNGSPRWSSPHRHSPVLPSQQGGDVCIFPSRIL